MKDNTMEFCNKNEDVEKSNFVCLKVKCFIDSFVIFYDRTELLWPIVSTNFSTLKYELYY